MFSLPSACFHTLLEYFCTQEILNYLSSPTAAFTGHKKFCPKRAVSFLRNKNSDCLAEEPKKHFCRSLGFICFKTLMMRGRNIKHNSELLHSNWPIRELSLDKSSYYFNINFFLYNTFPLCKKSSDLRSILS